MAGNSIRISAFIDDKVTPTLAKMRDQFDTLGKTKGFKSIAQGVGIGAGISAWGALSSGISIATDFMGDSIKAASNLNEQMSKANVVFGHAANGIQAWGETTGKALGLSKRAALEAAGTFGNLFVGLDLGEDKAADMSKRLVTLAADLASFNNLDPEDVLEKLRSGLAGEAEPLRRVGVFLSEAKVQAKAMELGFGKLGGKLTEGQKLLARYQIILDETATAQGDFARTSESLANQQRIATAELENAQAVLGEKLIPAQLLATKATIVFTDALEQMIGVVDDAARQDLPALTGSLLNLVNPLFRVADIMGHDIPAEARKLLEGLLPIPPEVQKVNDAFKNTKENIFGFGRAGGLTSKKFWARVVAADAAEAADDMATAFEDAMSRITATLANDPIIIDGNIAEMQNDLWGLKNRLTELKKEYAKNPSATLRNEIKMVQGEIRTVEVRLDAANKKKEFLFSADKGKTLLSMLDRAGDKAWELYSALAKDAATLQLMSRTWQIKFRLSEKPGYEPRAAGGPVSAGQTYMVGERGPELFTPNTSGNITPNGGWGGVYLTVNYQSLVTPTPAQQQAVARALVPELTRELRRAGSI